MKLKNIAKKTAITAVVFLVAMLSVFCTSAVEGDESESVAPITEATTLASETTAETIATTAPPETVATEPETTEPVQTETEPEQTEAETEKVTEGTTRTTYAATEAVTYSLPSAEVDTSPTAVVVPDKEKKTDLTYGIVSWACVITGVLVVIIVLISNKTQYHSGSGKHRYDEGNKITGQKRLLNDDYYNSRKTESYYSKDKRR